MRILGKNFRASNTSGDVKKVLKLFGRKLKDSEKKLGMNEQLILLFKDMFRYSLTDNEKMQDFCVEFNIPLGIDEK